jgi:hypothetical protein
LIVRAIVLLKRCVVMSRMTAFVWVKSDSETGEKVGGIGDFIAVLGWNQ